jgi:hypothetical protein
MRFILAFFLGFYLSTGICQNNFNTGSYVAIPAGCSFTEVKYETILDTISSGLILGKATFNINYLSESYVRNLVKYSTSVNEILYRLETERVLLVEYERNDYLKRETSFYFSIGDNLLSSYKELNISWIINDN